MNSLQTEWGRWQGGTQLTKQTAHIYSRQINMDEQTVKGNRQINKQTVYRKMEGQITYRHTANR